MTDKTPNPPLPLSKAAIRGKDGNRDARLRGRARSLHALTVAA